MADRITARDLMVVQWATIPPDGTLGLAMRTLTELQVDPAFAHALAVVDAEGRFEGLITPRLLLKSLLALWQPSRSVREDPAALQRELLAVVADRKDLSVHDTLIRGLSTVAPDARLLDLIEAGCDRRMEFVPVVESDRLVGLVPITAVFQAAAGLALRPQDEGIRMEREE